MTIDIEHMGVHILNESDVCAMIEQNAALAAALADRGHSEACLPGRCHCVKGRVSEILATHDAEKDKQIAALTLALARYGCHDANCAFLPSAESSCTCGFSGSTKEGIKRLERHDAAKDQKIAELAVGIVQIVSLFSQISLKGHKTGYDWNADPESLTLIGSRIFEALHEPEKVLAAHDASVRRPLLEALRDILSHIPHDALGTTFWEDDDGTYVEHDWADRAKGLLERYNDDGRER